MVGMRFYDENNSEVKSIKANWSEHKAETLKLDV
jgi:hypothetical protein